MTTEYWKQQGELEALRQAFCTLVEKTGELFAQQKRLNFELTQAMTEHYIAVGNFRDAEKAPGYVSGARGVYSDIFKHFKGQSIPEFLQREKY